MGRPPVVGFLEWRLRGEAHMGKPSKHGQGRPGGQGWQEVADGHRWNAFPDRKQRRERQKVNIFGTTAKCRKRSWAEGGEGLDGNQGRRD